MFTVAEFISSKKMIVEIIEEVHFTEVTAKRRFIVLVFFTNNCSCHGYVMNRIQCFETGN
jgi:hypothetical protein